MITTAGTCTAAAGITTSETMITVEGTTIITTEIAATEMAEMPCCGCFVLILEFSILPLIFSLRSQ